MVACRADALRPLIGFVSAVSTVSAEQRRFIVHKDITKNKQQTPNKQQSIHNKQQTATDKQPTTNKQQATNSLLIGAAQSVEIIAASGLADKSGPKL